MWSTNRSRSLVCLPAVLLIVACTCACAQDSAEQLRERVQRGEDGRSSIWAGQIPKRMFRSCARNWQSRTSQKRAGRGC